LPSHAQIGREHKKREGTKATGTETNIRHTGGPNLDNEQGKEKARGKKAATYTKGHNDTSAMSTKEHNGAMPNESPCETTRKTQDGGRLGNTKAKEVRQRQPVDRGHGKFMQSELREIMRELGGLAAKAKGD